MTERENIIDRMSDIEVVKFIELGGIIPAACTRAIRKLWVAKDCMTRANAAWESHRAVEAKVIHERAVNEASPTVPPPANSKPGAMKGRAA